MRGIVRRRHPIAGWVLIVLVAASCSGAGAPTPSPTLSPTPSPSPSPSPSPATHLVVGTLVVAGKAFEYEGKTACVREKGLRDVGDGSQVVLTDQKGTVIGTATVGVHPEGPLTASNDCQYQFLFFDVPDVPFYTFTIGRRGGLTLSLEELEGQNWTVGLSLG